AEINEFFVLNQLVKSMASRIHRAMEHGAPTCGSWPIGRIWDKDKKTWSVDEGVRAKIQAIAERYLQGKKGEGLEYLARVAGMSTGILWKTLKHRCGKIWVQHFECKRLNIKTTVETNVPPLLDDDVIQDIQDRTQENKSGNRLHDYL